MVGKQPPLLDGIFQRPSLPSGAPATDAQVRSTILGGRSGIMPPFQNALDSQDIGDIIEYLHTLKASFKSLYRKRAERLAPSSFFSDTRFRYITRTCRDFVACRRDYPEWKLI
jgi:hypothetical protein